MDTRTIQALIDENPLFETAFLSLYCKAQETLHPYPIIHDPVSVEILQRLEYDFSYFAHNRDAQYHVALRTKIFDAQTRNYCQLARTPLVINLGAGLDTRQARLGLDNVPWYNLDLEPVLRLRKALMPQDNQARYIATSAFDFSWMHAIAEPSEAPLILAEDLFMYCPRAEVAQLFGKLCAAFPTCIVLFDVFHAMLAHRSVKSRQKKHAHYTWGIRSLADITDLYDRIAIRDEWPLFHYDIHRQHWTTRLLTKINPNIKELVRVVEIDFAA